MSHRPAMSRTRSPRSDSSISTLGVFTLALMPVADALAAILAGAEPLAHEMIALDAAFHRVLARDVAALRTQPPQAMSAMDGYAVRAADAAHAQARLKVIGEVAAGRPFDQAIGPGEAVRIFTGGVIPDGGDAVVIQEDTVADRGNITVTEAATAGRHIRPAGVDFRQGDLLLSEGHRLTDRDLSLAASMNHPKLPVRRRPKVALLATGDELVMPGGTPGFGQIVYSNGYATRALARREGCEVVDLDIAPALETARLGCDLPRNDERADYLRAVLTAGPDGTPVAMPAPVQDSSMLMPLAQADCLLVREPFAPAAKAGERCAII